MPGKGNDLGDGAVQRFGNLVAQFHARQHARQVGVFVDRYFVIQRQLDDTLGQIAFALGGDGRGLFAALVEQGNGFAMFAHQVT